MRHALPSSPRSVSVDRGEIGLLQVRVVAQELILGHAGCEQIQNVPNSDPKSTDTGLSRLLTRYNRDPRKIGLISSGQIIYAGYSLHSPGHNL